MFSKSFAFFSKMLLSPRGAQEHFFSSIYPSTGYPFPCILFAVDLDVAVLLCLMPLLFLWLWLVGWKFYFLTVRIYEKVMLFFVFLCHWTGTQPGHQAKSASNFGSTLSPIDMLYSVGHKPIFMSIWMYIYVFIYIYMYISIYIYVYMCVSICIYEYLCICICIYTYMYIYTYIYVHMCM